jgi:uncharacterized protein (TIGR01244 family)
MSFTKPTIVCFLLITAYAALFAAGCKSSPDEHQAITTDKLEPFECGTITRLHTYKGVFLASQPSAADFEQAKEGGVKTVINLRHASEQAEFDEQAFIEGLDLGYHNVPWKSPDELTDEKFDEVRTLLREADRPILMHCSSANRVGAMWLAYRVLDEGATEQQAIEEAKIVGLRSPNFQTKALDYIKRQR